MTRDEERFLTCLKKSKSKVINRVESASAEHYCFDDVNQTEWSAHTLIDMMRAGIISLEIININSYQVSLNSTNC